MSQSINICAICSHPMFYLVNNDIYLCYVCAANTEIEMLDNDFFDKYPQPTKLCRSVCINPPETVEEHDDAFGELSIPRMKRCTAIDNCKNDPLVLKKNDDLYVSYSLNSHEIKSSITFKAVSNYRYNETTQQIEKIDPMIEEEDRRLIILQKNPNAVLAENL